MKNLFLLLILLPSIAFGRVAYNVYRMPSSGSLPGWGAIDVSQSAAVTGVLNVANGGTGQASFTTNCVLVGNSTTNITCAANSILVNQHPGADSGDIVISGASGVILGSVGATFPTWGTSSGDAYIQSPSNCIELGTVNNNGRAALICNDSSYSHGAIVIGDDSSALRPALFKNTDDSIVDLVLNTPLKIGYNNTGTDLQDFSNNTLEVCLPSSNSCFPAVVSATPSTSGLQIIRGGVNHAASSGTTCYTSPDTGLQGEGYGCTRVSTGQFVITFNTSYQDQAQCTCNAVDNLSTICSVFVTGTPTASVEFDMWNTSVPGQADIAFTFECKGQRSSSH